MFARETLPSGMSRVAKEHANIPSPSRLVLYRHSNSSTPRPHQQASLLTPRGQIPNSPVLRVRVSSNDVRQHELSFLSDDQRSSCSSHSSLDVQLSEASTSTPVRSASRRPSSPLLDFSDVQSLPGALTTLNSLLQVSKEIAARLQVQLETGSIDNSETSSQGHGYDDQVERSVKEAIPLPESGSASSLTDHFYTPEAAVLFESLGVGSATPRPPLPPSPSPSQGTRRAHRVHLLDSSIGRSTATSNQLSHIHGIIHIDDTSLVSDATELQILPQSPPTSPTTPTKSPRSGYKSTLRRSPGAKKPTPPVRPPRPAEFLIPSEPLLSTRSRYNSPDPFHTFSSISLMDSPGSPSPESSPPSPSPTPSPRTQRYYLSNDTQSSGLLSTIAESDREYASSSLASPGSWSTYSDSSFGHAPS